MLKLACICAYNEEKTISDVIKRSIPHVDKIIVCDDGSTDKTSEMANNAGAEVIKHTKNLGKGAALRTLFEYAKKSSADVVVTIDGDGQFLPEEIPIIIEPILKNESDIVIGYRFDSEVDMPKYRKFGNKVFDKVTNLASKLPLRDTQSGFRAYSKKSIQSIQFQSNGFGAESEILVNAANQGLKMNERKVSVIYKTGEKTSTKHPISHGTDVIGSLIELIAINHPLKYLGIPGFILLIIGAIYSVVVIAIFNDTRYFSIPSTMIALGSLIIGLMFLLMSVVLFSIQRSLKNSRI